jgi:hypothetical protein
MSNLLLTFLPDSALPLIIAGAGLLIMLGLVRPRTAFGFVGVFVVTIITTPFVEALFAGLPMWLTLIIIIVGIFWIGRTLLEALLGEHAAGHVIGILFVAATIGVFRLSIAPLRILVRAIRIHVAASDS